MSFLDKAKKLAEQAAEKAGPLIDKATPHAQNVVDKAGQQIDRRTGGKYRDKIEAVEAKVGELAEKRMAVQRGAPAAGPAGAAAGAAAGADAADGFPARPAPVDGLDGTVPARTGAADDLPAGSGTLPAQPDLPGGQADDPTHSGTPAGGFSTATPTDGPATAGPVTTGSASTGSATTGSATTGSATTGSPAAGAAEPAFSFETPDITYPAPVPDVTYPAEPDSRGGQPDDPAHSLAPDGTTEFPGLSEGPVGSPLSEEERPSGPPMGGSGTSHP